MTRPIDADLLRKNMEFICMGIMAGTDPYDAPLTEIDNAPTVEIRDNFDIGYVQGLEDGQKRPQGEWIIDGHHYKCSRCGKTLAIMFSETDDDDLIGCPFCLADMRGDKE